MFMGDKVIETGSIFLPANDGKFSFASRNDMAAAGAILLTTDGHEGKVYELGGPPSVSFHDISGYLTELSGKSIQYVSPPVEVYSEQLKGYGVPEQMIQGAATFCVAIAQGEFDFPSKDLQKILGQN
jgi:NAD(P)H dehydrogenase (quinone)